MPVVDASLICDADIQAILPGGNLSSSSIMVSGAELAF